MLMLFAGDDYYPYGGAEDLVGTFTELSDAIALLKGTKYDWWHIYDTTEKKIVWNSGNSMFGIPPGPVK